MGYEHQKRHEEILSLIGEAWKVSPTKSLMQMIADVGGLSMTGESIRYEDICLRDDLLEWIETSKSWTLDPSAPMR